MNDDSFGFRKASYNVARNQGRNPTHAMDALQALRLHRMEGCSDHARMSCSRIGGLLDWAADAGRNV